MRAEYPGKGKRVQTCVYSIVLNHWQGRVFTNLQLELAFLRWSRLRSFILDKGLIRLRDLESKGTDHLLTAFRRFNQLDWRRLRSRVCHYHPDTLYLPRSGPRCILDVSQVLTCFPEDDSGPQDAWMHTLLQNHIRSDIFRTGAQYIFSCGMHDTQWGFVFWDRQRLDELPGGPFATGKEMQEVSEGHRVYHLEVDAFTSHRNGNGSCYCRRLIWTPGGDGVAL